MDESENSDQLDSHYNWTSVFSTYRVLIDVIRFSLDLSIFTPEILSVRDSQSGGKMALSQISTSDAFTSSNTKRQWQIRDIETYGRNAQRT